MATIAEMLTMMNAGDTSIRSAIVAKGVAVPNTTLFTDLGSKITAIPQTGGTPSFGSTWGRNPERPELPFDENTGPDEGHMYLLFGVYELAVNDLTIYARNATSVNADGTVDWGDGIVEALTASTVQEHVYKYDTLTTTADTNGIKWVWIHIQASKALPITYFSFANTPSGRPSTAHYFIPQIYEWYMNMPSLTLWSWSTGSSQRLGLLEYFRWYGKCNLSSLANFGAYTLRLRDCIFDDSSSVTAFGSFLYYSGVCGEVKIDTSASSTFASFLRFTTNLNYPVNTDISKATNIATMMQNNTSYAYAVVLDVGALTTDIGTSAFTNCYALPSLRLLNMTTTVSSISVAYSAMSATALAELFSDLCDRAFTTTGTITITNAAGASALTTEQRLIAFEKNWNIVG